MKFTAFGVEFLENVALNDLIQKNQVFKEKYSLMAIALANPDLIAGMKHIEAAVWHAYNQFKNDKMIANTIDVELLLYLSGNHQIRKALKKVGLSKRPRTAIAIILSDSIPNDIKTIFETYYNAIIKNNLFKVTNKKKERIKDKLLGKDVDRQFNLKDILSLMANLALEK